jgi:hypothetical protein
MTYCSFTAQLACHPRQFRSSGRLTVIGALVHGHECHMHQCMSQLMLVNESAHIEQVSQVSIQLSLTLLCLRESS